MKIIRKILKINENTLKINERQLNINENTKKRNENEVQFNSVGIRLDRNLSPDSVAVSAMLWKASEASTAEVS